MNSMKIGEGSSSGDEPRKKDLLTEMQITDQHAKELEGYSSEKILALTKEDLIAIFGAAKGILYSMNLEKIRKMLNLEPTSTVAGEGSKRKKLSPEDILKLISEHRQQSIPIKEKERFTFDYKRRPRAESPWVQNVCKNFVNFYKKSNLSQDWSLSTIIGGSGIGKSRFSFESWPILLDYVNNHEAEVLEFLNSDKDCFALFKKYICDESIVEVFVKEINGNEIREGESIPFHLGCSLSSILVQEDPLHRRDYVSIGDVKRYATHDFTNISLILDAIRKKLQFPPDKPLTILWRVDEFQMVGGDVGKTEKILKEKDPTVQNELRHESPLYNYARQLMSVVIESGLKSTFVIPILSGTSDLALVNILPASSFEIVSIPLYLSDINVDTAYEMMHEIIRGNFIEQIPHLKSLLSAIGPIPRLVQFAVEYLIGPRNENVLVTLKRLYDYMKDQVRRLYRLNYFHDLMLPLMRLILDQVKYNEITGTWRGVVNYLLEGGHVFLTAENTLMLPLLFVELLFEINLASEWKPLMVYISKGVRGELIAADIEFFPCYFYAFKNFLYLSTGTRVTTLKCFFRGAYIHEEIENTDLTIGEMRVEVSEKSTVNNPRSVLIKGNNLPINLYMKYVALYIGKQNTHEDFLLSYPADELMVHGEAKFSESAGTTVFNGRSKGAFAYEQAMAEKSPCWDTQNIFLFVTNAHMDETNKENVVHRYSMFINKERWTSAFSPVFEFMKDL